MERIKVRSFVELHQALAPSREGLTWIFRGQSDAAWKLVPRAGRPPYDEIDDDALLAEWKANSIQYLPDRPRSELEWLAIAQHHGLATRLLDWSRNPLVAAFFAVWDERPTDAALFAYEYCEAFCQGDSDSPSDKEDERFDAFNYSRPYGPNSTFCWIPDAITSRIARQEGVFTIHDPPATRLQVGRGTERLICIRIDRRYRLELRDELSRYGITRASLFPGLDGLASHLNWRVHLDYREPLRGSQRGRLIRDVR
jgi:hypothetical protein